MYKLLNAIPRCNKGKWLSTHHCQSTVAPGLLHTLLYFLYNFFKHNTSLQQKVRKWLSTLTVSPQEPLGSYTLCHVLSVAGVAWNWLAVTGARCLPLCVVCGLCCCWEAVLEVWCCLCRAWHEAGSQLTAADKRLTSRQRKLVGCGRERVWGGSSGCGQN